MSWNGPNMININPGASGFGQSLSIKDVDLAPVLPIGSY